MYSFLKALLHNPRETGAIFPSSRFLAKEMAAHVLQNQEGVVVELGAGTGVVTKALLQSGIQPQNIIVVESSKSMVKKLQRCFPTIQIIEGDAAELTTLLAHEKREIHTILSSLPLRSLPKATTQSILKQINTLLSSRGRYIQFTYSFTQDQFFSPPHFQHIVSKRIWMNLPPARVDVWA
ncbi:MAG: ribosomal adenine dimethylase [Gammaproteobacteria bacterium]|jgi:phospholipid N-methyltransferase|nr:ribosomal adenine dimethylase [Gammaproteobacteria bacterium]